jgi:hypothetical protein
MVGEYEANYEAFTPGPVEFAEIRKQFYELLGAS